MKGIHDCERATARLTLSWGYRQTLRAIIGTLLLRQPAGILTFKAGLGADIYNILMDLLSAREFFFISTRDAPQM
jgi:hypothetical protein